LGVRRRDVYNVLVGKTENPKDLDIDRKVILKWILRRPFGRAWTQQDRHTGTEHGNETSVFVL
jgi:hypothetical protein